jgi:hypothetical protein
MKKSTIIISIGIGLVLLYFSIKFEEEQGLYNKQKTYEQGMFEGANETLKYLVEMNYITEDVAKNEISKIDSVLQIRIEK